eukprot:756215-Hanusia_phi.AAC.4
MPSPDQNRLLLQCGRGAAGPGPGQPGGPAWTPEAECARLSGSAARGLGPPHHFRIRLHNQERSDRTLRITVRYGTSLALAADSTSENPLNLMIHP